MEIIKEAIAAYRETVASPEFQELWRRREKAIEEE